MMLTARITLALLLCSLLLISPLALSEERKPGWYKKIPLPEAKHGSIDLYLPSTYGKDPNRTYPVLMMSWPDGKPPINKLEKWAEDRQFILMGLNGSKNGPYEPNRQIQASALGLMGTLKASPNLVFTIGFSGGAQSGFMLSLTFKGKVAGILMIGQGGNDSQLPEPYVPVAYLYGERERNKWFIDRVTKALERQGNPVKHQQIPGGHVQGKPQDWTPLLDWLYFTAMFTHPQLSEQDKKSAEQLITDRLAGFDALTDEQKVAEVEGLLSIPKIASRSDVNPMADSWFKIKLAKASQNGADPVESFYQVEELLAHPLAKHKGVEKADYKSATTLRRTLLKDKAVRRESSANKILQKVISLQNKLKQNAPKSRTKQVKDGYQHLIDKYAGTRAAATAEKRLAAMNDAGKKKK